jgi:hypothetical protein
MSLTEREIGLVLQQFPKFELSYEIITHKKVRNADVILAIPEGNKCFAWFTNYNKENVCFILEIDKTNNIKNIKKINTSFVDSLSIGSIFYGSMFKYNNISCFSIEDIYYYKGKNIIHTPYSNKLKLLKDIFTNEISQSILNNSFIIFGIPIIYSDFNKLLNEIQLVPYKVNQIKFRFFDKNNSRKIMTMKYYKPSNVITNIIQKEKKSAVFKVMADINPDIYYLFTSNEGIDDQYDIAFVPDYKTSVMMNALFRNIKENHNLDAIEESDDEEDFEDSREDKYVYLDKSFNITCEYNYKFKRWIPISLASDNDKISSLNQIQNKHYSS